jgi:hypothetical protein
MIAKKIQERLLLACLAGGVVMASCQSAAAPAAPLQAGAAVSPKVLFYDPFSSVKSEWQQASGVWDTQTQSGYLVQKSDDPRQLNAIKYVQSPRIIDATLETSVRINPNRPLSMNPADPGDAELIKTLRYTMGAGLVFRMKDPQNYYMFRLAGEEGAVVGKMINGKWEDLCNPRVRDFLDGSRIGFRADNWYRLRVDVYGSKITAYINDEPVCSVSDSTFDIGMTGLVTFKAPADFDYLKITNKESEIRTQ